MRLAPTSPSVRAVRAAWRIRVFAGAVIWTVAAATLWSRVRDEDERRELTAISRTRDWVLDRRLPLRITLPSRVEIEVGDPVFFGTPNGKMTLIGEVDSLLRDGNPINLTGGLSGEFRVSIRAGDREGLDSSSRATYISVPQTAAWVMKTLLPEERLSWIAAELNDTLLRHREEVFAAINPLLQNLVLDAERLATSDLPVVFDRHRAALTKIVGEFQNDVLRDEFLPLLRDELFPLLFKRAQPTLDAIGKEVLAKLPVWSLTWRLVYEKLPLTTEGHVTKAWNRFVESEVVPILKRHIDDALGAIGDVIGEASRNPNAARALRRSFGELIKNRELQHQVRLIFQELILDNPNFHEAMWKSWRSPEMTAALEKLSTYLAPLLTRIGERVLGTRGGGITPEFARVLRTQILQKDRRWILLEPGDGTSAPLTPDAELRASIQENE